jgi:hypothetical protein
MRHFSLAIIFMSRVQTLSWRIAAWTMYLGTSHVKQCQVPNSTYSIGSTLLGSEGNCLYGVLRTFKPFQPTQVIINGSIRSFL